MKFTDDHPRLFLGPMSKEIVDCAIQYSNKTSRPIGLIPSRRQVEHDGGYVNDWATKEFSKYVLQKSDRILLVRDHGGPGQGQAMDDGIISLTQDIDAGFDYLHIDPWKTVGSIEEGIQKTTDLINYCCSLSDSVNFEVGTEQAIFSYTPQDLDLILTRLETSLKEKFNRVKYAVVQSGVKISGTKNIGNFNPGRLRKMTQVCHDRGLISKEHNGDYLTVKEISQRVNEGLDCINIAPEFGVIQTNLLVDTVFTDEQFELAYRQCEKSKKYVKWLPENMKENPPKGVVVSVSGHYVFTQEPFKSEMSNIETSLQKILHARFDEIVECWS